VKFHRGCDAAAHFAILGGKNSPVNEVYDLLTRSFVRSPPQDPEIQDPGTPDRSILELPESVQNPAPRGLPKSLISRPPRIRWNGENPPGGLSEFRSARDVQNRWFLELFWSSKIAGFPIYFNSNSCFLGGSQYIPPQDRVLEAEVSQGRCAQVSRIGELLNTVLGVHPGPPPQGARFRAPPQIADSGGPQDPGNLDILDLRSPGPHIWGSEV